MYIVVGLQIVLTPLMPSSKLVHLRALDIMFLPCSSLRVVYSDDMRLVVIEVVYDQGMIPPLALHFT